MFDIHASPTPEKITNALRHVKSEEQLPEEEVGESGSEGGEGASTASTGRRPLPESASMFSLVNTAANNARLNK